MVKVAVVGASGYAGAHWIKVKRFQNFTAS